MGVVVNSNVFLNARKCRGKGKLFSTFSEQLIHIVHLQLGQELLKVLINTFTLLILLPPRLISSLRDGM